MQGDAEVLVRGGPRTLRFGHTYLQECLLVILSNVLTYATPRGRTSVVVP